MKSMLTEVESLYTAIFSDLCALHPPILLDLQRDLSRLLSTGSREGLPFYTITLPSVAKWFDKSLSEGILQQPRPPHFGAKGKGDLRPRFLHGLFSLVFEDDGTLRLTPDASSVASIRQVLMTCKKLKMECEERYTNESVQSFKDIEECLPRVGVDSWNSDIPRWDRVNGHPIWGDVAELNGQTCLFDSADTLLQLDDEFDWEGLRRFSARVLHQFGQFDPFAIKPKHGPGAVSDKVDGFVKYDHLHWSDRLETVFPYDWHGSGTLSVPDYVIFREYPSKMHAVPKTQSGPRLIAAEPTSHMWIQQGIRHWLETRCKQSILSGSLDFSSQEPSRERALAASLDGLSATVDLSSASDRLHVRLVEFLLQHNRPLLDGLHASRTRAMVALDGDLLVLRKFATQGSAVIFPLQSICYCILAIWSVALTRNCKDWQHISSLASEVRVFGDDIIVPTDAYPVLKGLLESLLLKVNVSKTHATGFFRESCGMDAFHGVDVTPAYFRQGYSESPESLASVVETSNNFFRKGYWAAATHLAKTVPEAELKLIPVGIDLGAVSLTSYCGIKLDHLKTRWNKDLHRYEVQLIDVVAKPRYKFGNGEGGLTQYLFEVPNPDYPYKSGQPAAPLLRKKKRWVSTER